VREVDGAPAVGANLGFHSGTNSTKGDAGLRPSTINSMQFQQNRGDPVGAVLAYLFTRP
jgi:hypothetical protein